MTKLEDLSQRLAVKTKELKAEEKLMEESAEFKTLNKREDELSKEYAKLSTTERTLSKEITDKFIDDPNGWASPWYDKSKQHYHYTNIREEVLDAMKKKLTFSKLRQSDIENCVRRMIKAESDKSVEIADAKKTLFLNNAEQNTLREKLRQLHHSTSLKILQKTRIPNLRDEVWDLRKQIDRLEYEKAHPEKLKKHDEQDAEREKAISESTVSDILKILEESK